jgi:molecular chaperone HscB
MNYFELFDIPLQLQVNTAELKTKYLQLSRLYHPDFHTQEDPDKQQVVLEKSSQLNKAWQVFQNPLQTIQYALQILNILKEGENPSLPPAFLAKVMELNEQLSSVDPTHRGPLIEQISTLQKELHASADCLLKDPATLTNPGNLEKVKSYYFQQKYLDRIQERLNTDEV